MALSNWMTRQEWNGAYTLYMCEVLRRRAEYPTDLSTLLRTGVCLMARAGYQDWGGITVSDPMDPDTVRKAEKSRYGVNACTAEGNNAGCLLEQMTGELDLLARMREFREWAKSRPELDLQPYHEPMEQLDRVLRSPEDLT